MQGFGVCEARWTLRYILSYGSCVNVIQYEERRSIDTSISTKRKNIKNRLSLFLPKPLFKRKFSFFLFIFVEMSYYTCYQTHKYIFIFLTSELFFPALIVNHIKLQRKQSVLRTNQFYFDLLLGGSVNISNQNTAHWDTELWW